VSSTIQTHAAPHAAHAFFRPFEVPAPALFSIALCFFLAACGGENQITLDMTPTPPQQNAAGNLDVSFGGTGFFEVHGPNNEPITFAGLKPLPGGGYLIAGSWESSVSGNERRTWFITKLGANGTADTTYGTGGSVTWERAQPRGSADYLLVDAQGRALLIGTSCTAACGPLDLPQSSYSLDVRRFNANGTPDNSFGVDSVFSRPGFGGSGVEAVLQADGRIVIATASGGAAARSPLNEDWLRLTANGQLDATFPDFPSSQVPLTDTTFNLSSPILLSRPDGMLINGHQRTLSRFSAQGVLDTTFAGKGWTQLGEHMSALAIDQSANVHAFARTLASGVPVVQALYRVRADDPTATPQRTSADDLGAVRVDAMGVQTDGRIVVAGSIGGVPPNGGAGSFIARRLANGSPDTGFAASSSRKMAIFGLGATVRVGTVLFDPAGKIVIAGQSDRRLFVLRYLP
jgi:uncharacterized delta-60 repeat protein